MKVINANGLGQIRDFLVNNHKKGNELYLDCCESMILPWADEAEFQLGEGNPPVIELSCHNSVHGYTQTFTVSDAGLDCLPDDSDD